MARSRSTALSRSRASSCFSTSSRAFSLRMISSDAASSCFSRFSRSYMRLSWASSFDAAAAGPGRLAVFSALFCALGAFAAAAVAGLEPGFGGSGPARLADGAGMPGGGGRFPAAATASA